MKRNFRNFNLYLDRLQEDIYPQPEDAGHEDYAQAFIDWTITISLYRSVLDVGCGQGFCMPLFLELEIMWTGVTLGSDYYVCKKRGLDVYEFDMTFLEFPDNHFDAVFARHTLEHSPFPILTLMEWKRVCSGHLLLVLPSPEYWGFKGRNHYSVLTKKHWGWIFERSGWSPIHEKVITTADDLFFRNYHLDIPDLEEKDLRRKKDFSTDVDVEYWYILEHSEEVKE